ncbi:MAG: 3-dehydroquinate synthase [Thermoprotei archaeon]
MQNFNFAFKQEVETRVVLGGEESLSALNELNGKGFALISDRLYESRASVNELSVVLDLLKGWKILLVPDGEGAKDVGVALNALKQLRDAGMQRTDSLLAVGGGTVTDLGGFLSSIYMRGTRLVNLPTTLLAMVDAALGGKNGVDFMGYKNLLGVIHQPSLVIEDLNFIRSLPEEDYRSGLSEVIKYAAVLDSELGDFLVENREGVMLRKSDEVSFLVGRSVQDKMRAVAVDEMDRLGIRAALNFGHTIGHAIEAGTNFKISHGRAVAVGMAAEANLGVLEGITSSESEAWLLDALRRYGLPTELNGLGVSEFDSERATRALAGDKKRVSEKIIMPFMKERGTWCLRGIELSRLLKVLKLRGNR